MHGKKTATSRGLGHLYQQMPTKDSRALISACSTWNKVHMIRLCCSSAPASVDNRALMQYHAVSQLAMDKVSGSCSTQTEHHNYLIHKYLQALPPSSITALTCHYAIMCCWHCVAT